VAYAVKMINWTWLVAPRAINNPFRTNGDISNPIDFYPMKISMKISRNFEKSSFSYILSFSKLKYKYLFYKIESIFMNFYRFFESL